MSIAFKKIFKFFWKNLSNSKGFCNACFKLEPVLPNGFIKNRHKSVSIIAYAIVCVKLFIIFKKQKLTRLLSRNRLPTSPSLQKSRKKLARFLRFLRFFRDFFNKLPKLGFGRSPNYTLSAVSALTPEISLSRFSHSALPVVSSPM